MDQKTQTLIEKYRELTILHPCYKHVPSRSHICTVDFVLRLNQIGFKLILGTTDGTYIAFARNELAENWAMVEDQCFVNNAPSTKAVLWLDSDHNFDVNDFLRLLTRFDQGEASILSARYLTRNNDREPTVCAFMREGDTHEYKPVGTKGTGLQFVDAAGMGFMLVHPKTMRALFEKHGRKLFEATTFGEDINFCEKAKADGWSVAVDNDVRIGHEGGELRG